MVLLQLEVCISSTEFIPQKQFTFYITLLSEPDFLIIKRPGFCIHFRSTAFERWGFVTFPLSLPVLV